MNRLTKNFSNGQVVVAGCGDNCKYNFKYCDLNSENCPTLSEIFKKLAFYEDLEEKNKISIVYDSVYPCTNCDIGWGHISAQDYKSCADDCERFEKY